MWAPAVVTRSWKARWPLARFLLPRRRLEERRKLELKVIVRIHAASPYLVILAAVKASRNRSASAHEIGGVSAEMSIHFISFSGRPWITGSPQSRLVRSLVSAASERS